MSRKRRLTPWSVEVGIVTRTLEHIQEGWKRGLRGAKA